MKQSIETMRSFKVALEAYINRTDKVSINTLLELVSVSLEPQCRVVHFYITASYKTCLADVKLKHIQDNYNDGVEMLVSLNKILRLYFQNRLQLGDVADILERIDTCLYDLRGFNIKVDIKLEQWAQV